MPPSPQQIHACCAAVYGHLRLPSGHLGPAYDSLIVDLCTAAYDAWSIAVFVINLFIRKGRNHPGGLAAQDAFDNLGPTEGLSQVDATTILNAAFQQKMWDALYDAVSSLWLEKQQSSMTPDEAADLWAFFLANRQIQPLQAYNALCRRHSLEP